MSDLAAQVAKLTKRLDKAAEVIRVLKSEMEGRVARLEQALGDHLREHQAWDAASHPPSKCAPRVVRTPGGKIRDPLLSELRARRADIGLSVRQLAGLLGYPRNTVSNWLNRDRAPRSQEDRVRIQEWLDLSAVATDRMLREWREDAWKS